MSERSATKDRRWTRRRAYTTSDGAHGSGDLPRSALLRVTAAADDRGEVGGHRGDCDHLDRKADPQTARGRVEGDHERDQRGQRPRAEQAEHRSGRVREVLDRDVGDPEQHPSRDCKQQRLATVLDVPAGRDPHQPDPERQDRGLDGDQCGQGGALRSLGGRGEADHRKSCGGKRHA